MANFKFLKIYPITHFIFIFTFMNLLHWNGYSQEAYKVMGPGALEGVKDVTGWDFSGFDLSNQDFSKVETFHSANFQGAKLPKGALNGKDLNQVNLSGVDLREQDLTTVLKINGANLSGVQLAKGVLNGKNLQGIDLSGTDLREQDLTTVLNLENSNLSGVQLAEGALNGKDLNGVDLSGVDLREQDFSTVVNLKRVILSGAQLPKGALNGKNLSGANLSGLDLTDQDLTTVVNLAWADLGGVLLAKGALNGKDLSGVNLLGVDLREQDLTTVEKFFKANLNGVQLAKGALNGKDLSYVNLLGVDLREQDLETIKGLQSSDKGFVESRTWIYFPFNKFKKEESFYFSLVPGIKLTLREYFTILNIRQEFRLEKLKRATAGMELPVKCEELSSNYGPGSSFDNLPFELVYSIFAESLHDPYEIIKMRQVSKSFFKTFNRPEMVLPLLKFFTGNEFDLKNKEDLQIAMDILHNIIFKKTIGKSPFWPLLMEKILAHSKES